MMLHLYAPLALRPAGERRVIVVLGLLAAAAWLAVPVELVLLSGF